MKTENPHLIIEVRAAEGGDDAKALVAQQVAIYSRLAARRLL
jgi:protein subunit release factor A